MPADQLLESTYKRDMHPFPPLGRKTLDITCVAGEFRLQLSVENGLHESMYLVEYCTSPGWQNADGSRGRPSEVAGLPF